MGKCVVLARNHVEDIIINYGYLMYNDYGDVYELAFYFLDVLIEIEIS